MRKLSKFREWLEVNGIGVTKGYQLVKDGRLKTVKIGKNRFITEDDAQAFVDGLSDDSET